MRRKRILQKENGGAEKMLPLFITVIACAVMMYMFISCVGACNQADKLDRIARKYLLKMEIEGYLTDERKTELETELLASGFSDIRLGSTTTTEKDYGEPLLLEITATFAVHFLNTDEGESFSYTFESVPATKHVCYTSTSKN